MKLGLIATDAEGARSLELFSMALYENSNNTVPRNLLIFKALGIKEKRLIILFTI